MNKDQDLIDLVNALNGINKRINDLTIRRLEIKQSIKNIVIDKRIDDVIKVDFNKLMNIII